MNNLDVFGKPAVPRHCRLAGKQRSQIKPGQLRIVQRKGAKVVDDLPVPFFPFVNGRSVDEPLYLAPQTILTVLSVGNACVGFANVKFVCEGMIFEAPQYHFFYCTKLVSDV